MNWLTRMYKGPTDKPTTSEKNPNRVSGGLRAQGVDRVSLLGEDGNEHNLPSLQYVNVLEEKIKKQQGAINILERKISRMTKELEQIKSTVDSMTKR